MRQTLVPQLTGVTPGGVLVFSTSCPVRMLTHQQYPVDPEHCCGRKFPFMSHCGTNAPICWMVCWFMYSQRPICLEMVGMVELMGLARLKVRMAQSARDILSNFMATVMKWECGL